MEEGRIRSPYPYLDKVDGNFVEYHQRLEQNFEGFLYQQRQPIVEIMELFRTYYFYLSYVADAGALSDCHQAVKMLLSKASTDIFAIYNCVNNGCLHQASVILRSLFETALNVLFIYQDFDKRIKLFSEYKYTEYHHKMRRYPDAVPTHIKIETKRVYKVTRRNYTERKPWYYNPLLKIIQESETLRDGNREPNLGTLALVLDMREEYDRLYSTLSLATHGSNVLEHLFVSNNSLTMAPVFNIPLIKTTVGLAVDSANKVFTTVLSVANNSSGPELVDYCAWLEYVILKMCSGSVSD